MAQKNIDFGAFPDDPGADAIRTAFSKVQQNFTELYAGIEGGAVQSVNRLPGAGITVNSPTGNVIVSANIGCVQVSTTSLSIGRGANGSSTAVITASNQWLVVDLPNTIMANNITVANVAEFGTLSNVHIAGGFNGASIVTDGLGNLTWGAGGGGGAMLGNAVPIIGTSVGAKDAGYVFAQGTTFEEFVVLISQKTIPPTYYTPSLSVSGSPSPTNTEIGTTLTVTISGSYNAGSGGAITATRVYNNGVEEASAFPYADAGFVATGTPVTYNAQIDYAQGPILNDSLGTPYPSGRINAGTASSNTLSYTGIRMTFYGTPVATPTTSADVRALGTSTFTTANNADVDASGTNLTGSPTPSFTITIPIGATRVCFAYPATSRVVASVRYQELSDSEVKGNFTETSISVAGAASYAGIAYRVFTYVPVEPFSVVNHYKVFI
jgi:hypothetical protein